MRSDRSPFRQWLVLIVIGVFLNFFLGHLSLVWTAVCFLFSVARPFLFGAVAAFILNVPLSAVERFLFPEKKPSVVETVLLEEQKAEGALLSSLAGPNKKSGKSGKSAPAFRNVRAEAVRFKRPISVAVTILLVLAVIALVFGMVVPELTRTVGKLTEELPGYFTAAQKWLTGMVAGNPELSEYLAGLEFDWTDLSGKLVGFLKESRVFENLYGTASSFVGGVTTAAVGLIFSFYILMQKETLGRQARMILDAFLPKKVSDEIVRIASLTSGVFSRFLSGQCTEAVILGTMFVIAMTVCGFPYALLCGVLIGFTALIPVFGAFIGCVVGAFLILMTAPEKTIWFIILFLVLQQVEGQFIYPHVVGSAVGLPAIWVLVAVMVGGSLFGIVGMLFFIPLSSVLYALTREWVYKRLKKRGALPEKESESC